MFVFSGYGKYVSECFIVCFVGRPKEPFHPMSALGLGRTELGIAGDSWRLVASHVQKSPLQSARTHTHTHFNRAP